MKYLLPYLLLTICFSFTSPEPKTLWNDTFQLELGSGSYFTDIINLPNGKLGLIGHSKEGKVFTPFFMSIDPLTGKESEPFPIIVEGEAKITSLAPTDDGHLILVGNTKLNPNQKIGNGWLLKITFDGKPVKSKVIPTKEGHFYFEKIAPMDSGKNLLVGQSDKVKKGTMWMGTVDSDLKIKTLPSFGNGSIEQLADLQSIDGKTALLCANTKKSESTSKGDALCYEIEDSSFPITDRKKIGSSDFEHLNSLSITPRGEVIIGGYRWTKGGTNKDGFISFWKKKEEIKSEVFPWGFDSEVTAVHQSLKKERMFLIQRADGKFIEQSLYYGNEALKSIMDFNGRKNKFFDIKKIIKTYHGSYIMAGTQKRSRTPEAIRLHCIKINKNELVQKVVNTRQLALEIEEIYLKDQSKDKSLSPKEEGKIKLQIKNIGNEDIIAGQLRVVNSSELKNIVIPNEETFVNFLEAGGASRTISIRVQGAEDLIETVEELKMEFIVDGFNPFPVSYKINTSKKRKVVRNTPFITSWQSPSISKNPSRQFETNSKKEQIHLTIFTSEPIEKSDVTVLNSKEPLVDDKAIDKAVLKQIPRGDSEYQYEFIYKITQLNEGANVIEIEIDGYPSDSIVFHYDPMKLPNLHILAIGPEYSDLKQTKNDAQDFLATISNHHAGNAYSKITSTILVDAENTEKRDIELAFNKLVNQFNDGLIKPKDYLMIFFSGHGTLIDRDFYLVPSDYDPLGASATAVDYKRILEKYLNKIHCKKVLFIDACLSGSAAEGLASKDVSEEAVAKFLLEASKVAEGTIIFTSCSNTEDSFEHEDWKNGAFTEALLEGLTGGTDEFPIDIGFLEKNSVGEYFLDPNTGQPLNEMADDSMISALELNNFLQRRVNQLIKSKSKTRTQTPTLEPLGAYDSVPIFIFEKK